MNFTKLQKYTITKRFPVGEDGFSVTWDANKFVGALSRRMAEVYRRKAQELSELDPTLNGQAAEEKEGDLSLLETADRLARQMEVSAALDEIDREMYADALACDRYGILVNWEMEEAGVHMPPTFEKLVTLKAKPLKDIFTFCREASLPKKEEIPTTLSSPTTELTTSNGSSSPTSQPPSDPVM